MWGVDGGGLHRWSSREWHSRSGHTALVPPTKTVLVVPPFSRTTVEDLIPSRGGTDNPKEKKTLAPYLSSLRGRCSSVRSARFLFSNGGGGYSPRGGPLFFLFGREPASPAGSKDPHVLPSSRCLLTTCSIILSIARDAVTCVCFLYCFMYPPPPRVVLAKKERPPPRECDKRRLR